MAVEVKCPRCGQSHQAPESLVGKKVRCKRCAAGIRIGGSAPAASPRPDSRTAGASKPRSGGPSRRDNPDRAESSTRTSPSTADRFGLDERGDGPEGDEYSLAEDLFPEEPAASESAEPLPERPLPSRSDGSEGKAKKPKAKKKNKRNQEGEGGVPGPLKPLLWLIGGLVGGAAGVAIWLGIVYAIDFQIRLIAVGVGLLVGIGVRAAARDDTGVGPGLVAVFASLISILVGNFGAVYIWLYHGEGVEGEDDPNYPYVSAVADRIVYHREARGGRLDWPEDGGYPPDVWEEARGRWEAMDADQRRALIQSPILVEFADEIAYERMEDGVPIEWPAGMTFEEAWLPDHYPPDLWSEARRRWDALGEAERVERMRDHWEGGVGIGEDLIMLAIVGVASSIFGIVWFVVAAITAYRIGSGGIGG